MPPPTPSTSNVALVHPSQNTTSKLIVLRDHIDVEEEIRLYEDICEGIEQSTYLPAYGVTGPPSFVSRDSIWLADHQGESLAFAQDVRIGGWTSVGDRLSGAYVVYDCVVKTKEGPVIHVHKRYSAFEELYDALRHTLPRHLKAFIPALPPKSPLAKFRPAFLDRRRRSLERWLSAVLLHPDVGASAAARQWVIDGRIA